MLRVAHCCLISIAFFACGASPLPAQVAEAQPVQYVNPTGELLPWVFSPLMQRELEIVDEQQEKLKKLQTEVTNETRDLYKTAQSEDRQEWMRKYNEIAGRLAGETDKRVREILLPHQVRRLRQIVLQTRLSGAGFGSAAGLTSGTVAEELGLTEEQKRDLQKKEKEVAAEVQRKSREFYERLREESEEELLSVLTDAQRRKLKDLVGERFDWQQRTKSPDKEKAKDGAKSDDSQGDGATKGTPKGEGQPAKPR